MPLASQAIDDFSGGIYSGRKAPGDTVYDLINGLINDEGLPFRRGGSAYYSASSASEAPRWLNAVYFPAVEANRVILASANNIAALNGSLNPVNVADPFTVSEFPQNHWSRPATIGDITLFATGPTSIFFYGGSLKTTNYTAGTVSTSVGSSVVTGLGTSWQANIDAGMLLSVPGGLGTVKSVDSDTSITLTAEFPSANAGAAYTLINGGTLGFSSLMPEVSTRTYVAAAGSGNPRLLFCAGNRVYFTDPGGVSILNPGDYHNVGNGANIIGAEGVGDAALIFTTRGIWRISNLSLDPVDAYGNIQQTVEQVNKDIILWDDLGIVGFAGNLVVPAVDDVFLMGTDGPVAITGRIRPIYRQYVDAGYQPGQAASYRGHYILPILNGTTVIDTLVCRLDRGFAWTRWAGGASGSAYAGLIAETAREPKLLGVKGLRVTNLTGCFTPTAANATDADGTTSDFEIVTRDMPLGANQPGFAQRIRARYEMVGATATAAELTTDTFERADETPLASPYLNWLTGGRPNLASGSVVSNGSFGGSTTRPETIGPDCEVQVTFDTTATYDAITSYFVGARLSSHSNSAQGYSVWLDPGIGGWKLVIRKDLATIATSVVVNYADVTGIRIDCAGSLITGSLKVSGVWTQAVSVTDATRPGAGFVGFGISTFALFGSPVGIEDFSWTGLPHLTVAFSSAQDGGTFTELTERGEQNGGEGWGDSDGSLFQWALVGKRRERIRFRLRVHGATASFVLRSLELLTRSSGKQ